MEAHRGVGLIQTLPVIVNGRSLFARMQQFAGRVYGPVIAHGIAFWHGAEGNYWGHNAIIRTARLRRVRPGCRTCPAAALRRPHHEPRLRGGRADAPRRLGACTSSLTLRGSYEESPPSLLDLAIRDRRWCQGNLQHLAVLPARGLHPISRSHLLVGIGSYITAPLWLLFLVSGLLLALQARFVLPVYFSDGPDIVSRMAGGGSPARQMGVHRHHGLLLVPKLLAWAAMLMDPAWRRGMAVRCALPGQCAHRNRAGRVAGTRDHADPVHGRGLDSARADSGWSAQTRDDGILPIAQVARLYWRHTAFGLVFGIAAFLISPYLAAWMSPVVLGLALAIPLAAWTARQGPGQALRRAGLLVIPEERDPPSILARTVALRREWEALAPAGEAVARLRGRSRVAGRAPRDAAAGFRNAARRA